MKPIGVRQNRSFEDKIFYHFWCSTDQKLLDYLKRQSTE